MILLVRLSRYVRGILLIFVLLLAGILSTARMLLPGISEYRAGIVSSISASIGKPIVMDGMAAGLNGIHPEVVLKGLKIIDPVDRKVLFRFDQLRAGLNVKEFLLTGNFQPRWVTIRGARLSVRRKLDGSIRVAGFDSGEEMPKWIFEDGHFELLDSEVDWQDVKHPDAGLHFSSADIRLLNADRRHKVAVDVDLPFDYGESLSIRMDFQGDLLLKGCCTGRIYVQGRDIRYAKLLEGLSPEGYRVVQGFGAFRLWSSWEKSVLASLAGEVDFEEGKLSHGSTGSEISEAATDLRHMSGGFHWIRQDQGWYLSVRRLALDLKGVAWPFTDIGLKRTFEPAGTSNLYLSSSYLKLDDLRQILTDLQVPAPARRQALLDTAPSGEIFDLKLTYSTKPGDEPRWFVCGRFENIGFRARQFYPGAKNLSGNLCGDRNNGRLQLAANQAEIELPKVFRNPIDLTLLEGEFLWHRDGLAWNIRSESIKTVNPVLAAETRMLLQIPLGEGEPFLDLQAAFANVDAASAHRYLPVSVLKKPLVEWLDAAFVSGTVSHGGTLFRGPVTAFPFRGGEGVFETLFYTQDVVLSYHPEWPVLHTEVAEVRFFQAGMSIRGERASLSGTRVEDVRADSANFEFDDYLKITGRAAGTLEQSIKFLKSTPLGPLYRPLLEYVSIRGDNRIDLELKVPIAPRVDDFIVNGTAALKKARLNAFGMQMDRISGTLDFSGDGIQGTGIRGELLDRPVRIEMSDNDRGLAVQIKGSVGLDSLAGRYPSGFWEYFDGESDYSMDLQIPKLGEKPFADIDLHSDLLGIAIKLPEPLGKQSTVPRSFNLKTHLESGREIPLDLAVGGTGFAQLKLAKTNEGFDLEQGVIKLGRVSEAQAAKNGLSFFAVLDRVDLRPWNDFRAALNRNAIPDTADLNLVDVQIAELIVEDADLGPFTLKMHRDRGVWDGMTESRIASGHFTGKTGDRNASGLNLDFEYLRIPEQDDLLQKTPKQKVHFDPGDIADLNIRAGHFYWKTVDYGTLEVRTTRQPHGMKIDRLNLRGNGLDLNLSGFWTASGSADRTFIAGNMSIDNLGQFLTGLGKSDVIRDSNVSSSVMLKWNDPLYDLNFETLSGNARVEFGAGRLLTVEPGIGRLFGLFNLDGLKNLLLLDFSKLFGQGLAFEGVESAFLLTGGHATIKRLIIDAVPAVISVAGEIDLVREQFDDVVTVVPKGVVAAGASMLLTQELPGTAVDGLIN
ncbi:MAG: TIGR02099 family protein, partial [Methylococcaceae bacterium]|nr:TIGR02099 family protein [Methylococcaceae bacterium]